MSEYLIETEKGIVVFVASGPAIAGRSACRDCGESFVDYAVEVPPSGEVVWADRCVSCVAETLGEMPSVIANSRALADRCGS